MIMKDTLELSVAQGHWELGSNWVVQDAQGEVIWEFPAGMDEHTVMSAIRLGRHYELEAFNRGICHGKSIEKKLAKGYIDRLEGQVRALEQMNTNLSMELERHIAKG